MTVLKAPYEGANKCQEDNQPGTIGAVRYCLDAFSAADVEGIVSECSKNPSVHAEGRAIRLTTGELPDWAAVLAEFFYKYSKDLGVQCVIWNRKIWSCSHADENWRPYTGFNPHTKIIHVELTKSMAQRDSEDVHQVWDYVAKYADNIEPTSIDPDLHRDEEQDNLEWS